MCDPFTSKQLTQLDVASAGVATIGSFASTKVARKNAKYAAALAEMRAHDSRARGGSEAARRIGKGAKQASQIRANTAARGFDVGEGTAVRLEDDATLLARIDANTIRDSAEREAYGHDSDAAQYRHKANTLDPFLSATGTLVGQVGRVASRWYSRKTEGVE